MRLIGLTGLPRSGKDTAAEYLVRAEGYTRRAFATPLKEAAALLLNREVYEMEGQQGFDREALLPEWGFSTRWFLQRFGTECMRNQIDQDFWIKRMRSSLLAGGSHVITDVRFQNEADLVHELGGQIIEISRPKSAGSSHISDAGVKADCHVWNNDTISTLHNAIKDIEASIYPRWTTPC